MKKGLVLFVFLPVITLAGYFDQPKCTDCHSDLIEKAILHTPAKEGCDACHGVNIKEHPDKAPKGLFLADSIPGLCYTCHDGVKQDVDTTRNVHQAMKDTKKCMNCHSPHSSDIKKLLTAGKKELCINCHDKELDVNGKKTRNIKQLLLTSKVIHPAVNGGCISCHKPHASTENYLLISAFPKEMYTSGKKENYAVCWECHDSDLLDLAKTATATSFRNGEQNLHYAHLKGLRGRSCVICHDVHASNNKFLIIDKIAFGQWSFALNFAPSDSGGSCAPGCHGKYSYKR